MGPAPAVAATRLAVRGAIEGRRTVLVACSGGPDSVALAAALAFEAPRAGVACGLVTVDHGLQDGSAAQAGRVLDLGRSLGLDPVETLEVEVGRSGGPEGAAREARYAALAGAAARHDAEVLLGHTRDDQAETVLLGLGRGSGPRSIAGMRAVDGCWLRPFLGLGRETTVAACTAQGLAVWQDPMNTDDRFVRVRLRHEVLPLLEDVLHGGVAASLARTADLVADDVAALDLWAERTRADAQDGPAALEVGPLVGVPRAVRTRVLRRWAAGLGAGPLTAAHTAALDALVTAWHGQGAVQLPGGVSVGRASGRLVLVRPSQESPARQE